MYELYLAAAAMGWREMTEWGRANVAAAFGGRRVSARSIAHVPSPTRDIRLDLFRGLALWFIFLDHIPGNVASWITIRNYGFSDATELFVFISGYTAALVYGRTMREQGMVGTGARILKRAWQIYVAHIFLFVIYTATIALVASTAGDPLYIDKLGLTEFFRQPEFMFLQVLLLRFKPVNMDVLPMYIAVLTAFAPLLWLLVRRPHLALAGAVLLYALARLNGWNLASHSGGVWHFNPFAWQLLFVFGAWCAIGGATWLGGLIRSRLVAIAALAYLVFAFAIVMTWHVPTLAQFVPASACAWIYPISKPNLDVLRIAHFLALALLMVRLCGRDQPILNSSLLRPMVRCGMHSLELFCFGVLLSFAAHALLVETSAGPVLQVVISAAGISLMIAVATLITWWGSIEEGKRISRPAASDAIRQPVVAPAVA